MYSSRIIDRRIASIYDSTGLALVRHPAAMIEQRLADLASAWDAENAKLLRRLTADETRFIRNETLLSMCDFGHWMQNYGYCKLDGGGLGHPRQWESQRIIMEHIAGAEERAWNQRSNGWPIEGIRVLLHKARQLGATLLSRMLTVHRMIFTKHINAMAASVDEDKVLELYDRDKVIYDNLPWWMKPAVRFDEKAAHIRFEGLNTLILYQQASQKSGLGQGRQFEVSHLTECASWQNTNVIALDFLPTIPMSIHTLVILESTAQGRGNWWHEYTEETRAGHHPEWTYIFVPWYAERTKYRLHPPDNWQPAPSTMAHAVKVRETSHEWCGSTVELDREQLYWYERNRASAQHAGELNLFLTNYCATPEESFQHSTVAAFSPELLDALRNETRAPLIYAEPTYAPQAIPTS